MLRTRQRLSDPSAGLPTWFTWDYDLAELIADAVVHASGLLAALIGAVMLAAVVLPSGVLGDSAAILVYVVGLVTTLGLSATYNLWPVSPMKWVLRRFDHSTIYLFIAATYTPFLPRITSGFWTVAWLVYIWGFALAGAALKLILVGPPGAGCGCLLCSARLVWRVVARASAVDHVAVSRVGWPLVLDRNCLSSLGPAALPECDLAFVCPARRGRALFRRADMHRRGLGAR